MLDDINVIGQRDPDGALDAIADLPSQMNFQPEVVGDIQPVAVTKVIMAGMGGSALAADMAKVLTVDQTRVPIEVVKGYGLPGYADETTLVLALSHSGNTEETIDCYHQAKQKKCLVVAMSTGGKLEELAVADGTPFVRVPAGSQPRMLTIYHLRIVLTILQRYSLIDSRAYDELANSADWLKSEIANWSADKPTAENYAKQLAVHSAGKIGMFFGGQFTATLAYKWKISWNESSKNLAFWNQFPEFSHNEFIGWSSHPIEKPFAVFDIRSSFERPRNIERMELTDRMLSGMRPKATVIELQGDSEVKQMLWGLALADMTSIYLGLLNNVNPVPVELVERFKKELS